MVGKKLITNRSLEAFERKSVCMVCIYSITSKVCKKKPFTTMDSFLGKFGGFFEEIDS